MDQDLTKFHLMGRLVESNVREFREEYDSEEFNLEELNELLELEERWKNRKTIKKIILQDIEDKKKKPETDLSKETLLKLTSASVAEMKEWVKENKPDDSQLEELLHAEKLAKDRKTAKEFLKSKTKEKHIEADFKQTTYDFLELKEDLERLNKELNMLEESDFSDIQANQPKTENESQESEKESKEKTTNKDDSEAEKEEEDKQKSETDQKEESPENEEDKNETVDNEENEADKLAKKKEIAQEIGLDLSDEELEEAKLSDLKNTKKEKERRNSLLNELVDLGYDRSDLEETTTEDLEKLKSDIKGEKQSIKQKREQLIDEIAPILKEPRDELEKLSYQELKELESEKETREKLIEELSSSLSRSKLEEASTADLKELKKEKENMSDDRKKLEEEAEEDLELLKGAKAEDKEEDEGSENKEEDEDKGPKYQGALAGLKYFRDDIKASLGMSDDSEDYKENFNDTRILSLLDEYGKESDRKAVVKTAHVMKGYLEDYEDIERELTYKELAEEIKEENFEGFEELSEYFRKLGEKQYTGDIEDINSEKMIEASRKVIKNT